MSREYYCSECRKSISEKDNYCEYCGSKNEYWKPKEEDFCNRCHKPLKEDEQQCPICGQPRNDPFFTTHRSVVYGPPPVTRNYKCPNSRCGHEWSDMQLFDRPGPEYCPKCGTKL